VAKSDETALVLAAFQHYAARGSFRSLTADGVGDRVGNRIELRFTWLRDVACRVVFDATRRTLTFVDLLPAIGRGSPMDRSLRVFVRRHTSPEVPVHRRVDPRRVKVTVVNRGGAASIAFALRTRDVGYAVQKAVHLVHDVLQDFLNDGRYLEYCVEHFNLNPEMA
jgi:hypothetical protein